MNAPKMVSVNCKNCKRPFQARKADVNRGWGKFCSKSCKAREQEKRTGQYAKYKRATPRDAGPDGEGGRLFYANFSNEEGSDI